MCVLGSNAKVLFEDFTKYISRFLNLFNQYRFSRGWLNVKNKDILLFYSSSNYILSLFQYYVFRMIIV